MVQAAFDGLTGLVRLIYASRWNVPEGRALDEEVRKIVIASMNNNRLVNVTGHTWTAETTHGALVSGFTAYFSGDATLLVQQTITDQLII